MLLKYFIFLSFLIGCQTTPKPTKDDLPAWVLPIFDRCKTGDGGGGLNIRVGSRQFKDLTLDWVRDKNGLLGEVSGPIGQTMVSFRAMESSFEIGGQLKKNLPLIRVDDKGFLEIDGSRVALKIGELACILNFKLPFAWLESLEDLSSSEQKIKMQFSDGDRIVWSEYGNNGKQFCTTVKWNQYLGMLSHRITWCQNTLVSPWKTIFRFGEDYIELVNES